MLSNIANKGVTIGFQCIFKDRDCQELPLKPCFFINTEVLIVEEPSFLQESAHSDTERKIRHDSFMLPSENNRNETDDHCGETIVSSFHKF